MNKSRANITINYSDELRNVEVFELLESLNALEKLEQLWSFTPLSSTLIVTLSNIRLWESEDEEDAEFYESYTFAVTRRFTRNGRIHVGGANGEVLNVPATIEKLREILVEELEERGE